MDAQRSELEELRAENAALRRSGTEAVMAYKRQSKKADEMMESLIELQARYDALAAAAPASTTTPTTTTPPPPDLEARVLELELALVTKDEVVRSLQAAYEEKEAELAALKAAAATATATQGDEASATAAAAAMGLVEHAFDLLESQSSAAAAPMTSTSTSEVGTQVDMGAAEAAAAAAAEKDGLVSPEKKDLKATIHSLLEDLAHVRDFAGTELAVTKEVLQEENEAREQVLAGEVEGMRHELDRVRTLMAEVKAQAAEQARRDSQAIEELEVTVQLTEGALEMAKKQQEAAAASAAAAKPEGGLSPDSTVKLQGAMADLRGRLNDTERRAQEAELGRGQLMQELERMEDRLKIAEQSLLQAEHEAEEAAAAAVVVPPPTTTTTSTGTSMTPVKGAVNPTTPSRKEAGGGERSAPPSASASAAKKTCAELRRLKAELLQTKASLDTAKTNTNLLQRYIAVRKIVSPGLDVGGATAASLLGVSLTAPPPSAEKPVGGGGGGLFSSPPPSSASKKKAMARFLFSPPAAAASLFSTVPAAAAGAGERRAIDDN